MYWIINYIDIVRHVLVYTYYTLTLDLNINVMNY